MVCETRRSILVEKIFLLLPKFFFILIQNTFAMPKYHILAMVDNGFLKNILGVQWAFEQNAFEQIIFQ